ncbi:hypothetical protein J4G33_16640 [Actinotalea sp. BY-33]|uniref:Uncharacterized protein n=1 Tax=Actinotalea soli TaxID=2819234 RepID=A0A939LRW5_9CELL|nr:hypothetical protein [Actinotalea soli]MBO1753436.1 hypothetical protein [Actinotalea soli]
MDDSTRRPRGDARGAPTGPIPAGTGEDSRRGRREAEGTAQDAAPAGRRIPRWAFVVGAVVLVAAVVGIILAVTNNAETAPPPDPQIVTLPVPTPTVEPAEREEGTAFFEALPSTILAFALTETAEESALVEAGAIEAYRFDYSDGSQEITVRAGQWADAEETEAALAEQLAAADEEIEAARAEAPSEEEASEEGTAEESAAEGAVAAPGVDEGTVEVDREEVGRYVILTREDGTATAWWTNGTVLLQVDGPAAAVRDVYTGYPL